MGAGQMSIGDVVGNELPRPRTDGTRKKRQRQAIERSPIGNGNVVGMGNGSVRT